MIKTYMTGKKSDRCQFINRLLRPDPRITHSDFDLEKAGEDMLAVLLAGLKRPK